MTNIRNSVEIELLTQLSQQDPKAFKKVYDQFFTRLFIHARKMLQDDEAAKDVVQEVFLTLWRKAATIEITTSLSSYLYTALRNRILNHFEHEKVVNKFLASARAFSHNCTLVTDEAIRERELAVLIEIEIQQLPPKMRTVFEMSRKSGLSHRVIAEELSLSETTVKKQINNALKILKSKLSLSTVIIFGFLNNL